MPPQNGVTKQSILLDNPMQRRKQSPDRSQRSAARRLETDFLKEANLNHCCAKIERKLVIRRSRSGHDSRRRGCLLGDGLSRCNSDHRCGDFTGNSGLSNCQANWLPARTSGHSTGGAETAREPNGVRLRSCPQTFMCGVAKRPLAEATLTWSQAYI